MSVLKVYEKVVEDVIANVRESFLDEGVDEQVLQELKQLWESKLVQTRAVEHKSNEGEPQMLSAQYVAALQQQQPQAQILTPAIDLSQSTQATALALPAGLQPQQLAALQAGTITVQGLPHGTQFVLQQLPGQPMTIQQAVPAQQPGVITVQPQPQQQIHPRAHQPGGPVTQLDGANDTSSDEDDDDDDNDDNDDEQNEGENDDQGEEEEPLNSDDDVSDDDSGEIFETDNVIVCQYEKINRCRNRWKFHLKDGIMNLKGKDYVFSKSVGDADW